MEGEIVLEMKINWLICAMMKRQIEMISSQRYDGIYNNSTAARGIVIPHNAVTNADLSYTLIAF